MSIVLSCIKDPMNERIKLLKNSAMH